MARHSPAAVEAVLVALRDDPRSPLTEDSYLNLMAEVSWSPSIRHLQDYEEGINRFAFVIHPLDIGFVDEDGRLSIADRSKDLILRGGASIYPSEVESVLTHHPSVREAAVVGKADDYYGEEVVALIVLREPIGPEAIERWVRERLTPYKVPRFYAFVESLPRSSSGKTLKRKLRERVASGELPIEALASNRPTD